MRAHAHVKALRYDEAIQCHQNAADYLLEAMKTTTSKDALDCLNMQHAFHIREKEFIKMSKNSIEEVREHGDMVRRLSKDPNTNLDDHEDIRVQIALYRNVDKTKTLLNALHAKRIATDVIKKTDKIDEEALEKSQQAYIAELLKLVDTQRSLVQQVTDQLKDALKLKKKQQQKTDIQDREIQKLFFQSNELIMQNKYPIRPVDSSGNNDSPTVSADQQRTYNVAARPQQPHFDLSAFKDDE